MLRRVRGAVLRLAFRRGAALAAGAAGAGAGLWLLAIDAPWESWLTDGAGLVVGASGAALVIAALGGRRPDWID